MGTVVKTVLGYYDIVNFRCDASTATEAEIEVCVGRMNNPALFLFSVACNASSARSVKTSTLRRGRDENFRNQSSRFNPTLQPAGFAPILTR